MIIIRRRRRIISIYIYIYRSLSLSISLFLLRTSPPSLGKDTLGLGTPGTLRGWARDLGLGTPGTPVTLWGWAIQRETLGSGTPGRLGLGTPGDSGAGHSGDTLGWALRQHSGLGLGLGTQGGSGAGHSRDTLELGTQGQFGVGHSRDERGVDRAKEKSSGRGAELSLKSNNPTPRVGNKERLPSSPGFCKATLRRPFTAHFVQFALEKVSRRRNTITLCWMTPFPTMTCVYCAFTSIIPLHLLLLLR